MIFRKDDLSAAKALLWGVALLAHVAQTDIELKVQVIEVQTTAQHESRETATVPDSAVRENAYPDPGTTVSLEKMEAEKKVLERLANELEGADRILEDTERRERESLEEKAKVDAGIKADAELAAAAIEKATADLENEKSEQARRAEQETVALEEKFKTEHDDLVGKLDKMRDKYFVNHPDLDQDQRTDAEGTFEKIKDDAVEALKTDQGTRLAEREAAHQGLQENYEQRRKELEGTRARDDRA
jgi:hypothetical protein